MGMNTTLGKAVSSLERVAKDLYKTSEYLFTLEDNNRVIDDNRVVLVDYRYFHDLTNFLSEVGDTVSTQAHNVHIVETRGWD